MARKGNDSLSEVFKTLGVREEGEGSRRSKEGRGGKKGKSEKMEKKGELERKARAKELERGDWEMAKEKMEKMFYWQKLPGMVEEMSPDERAQWDRDLNQLFFLMEKYDFKNQKDKEKLYPVIYSEAASRIIIKTYHYQMKPEEKTGQTKTKTKNKMKNKK